MNQTCLALLLICLVFGCDDNGEAAADDPLTRRLELFHVPGRHTQAWDAMFNLDNARARLLLADHITDDSFVTFNLPDEFGGDRDFAPGIDGWIELVVGSATAGGWVPAAPGYPQALHVAGSPLVLFESSDAAQLQCYVRATHYTDDTTTDFSEAILVFDLVWDAERATWLVAHLELTPLSLREEGGMALPPVGP